MTVKRNNKGNTGNFIIKIIIIWSIRITIDFIMERIISGISYSSFFRFFLLNIYSAIFYPIKTKIFITHTILFISMIFLPNNRSPLNYKKNFVYFSSLPFNN